MSIEPCYIRIGDRLRMAREVRNLSQLEVAKRAGITQSQVARIEKASYRCQLHIAGRLGMALGIGDELFRNLFERGKRK